VKSLNYNYPKPDTGYVFLSTLNTVDLALTTHITDIIDIIVIAFSH